MTGRQRIDCAIDDALARSATLDHVWFWRCRLPERKGQRCRVVARGAKNTVMVRFGDGLQVVTSRYAVRKAPA